MQGCLEDDSQKIIIALSHAFRRELLRFMIDHNMPVSPLTASRRLQEHPSNVNYHIKRLAEAGLVSLDSTRPVRGATEHLYLPEPGALADPVVQAILGTP